MNIPANWLALIIAGTACPGCSYTPGPYAFDVSFVGDSQTLGTPGVDGFRTGVNANLVARALPNVTWAYTGPTATGGTAPTAACGAVGGTTSVYWQSQIGSNWGAGKIRASVWRVMFGANDAFLGLQAGFGASCSTVFANIKATEPDSVVSVGRLVYPGGVPATIAQMNVDLAASVAAARAGGQAIVLEADAGIVVPTDIYQGDGLNVHFTATGNAKQATVASDGIVAALQLGGYL